MAFARLVHAETLDYLDEEDPRAIRSRADLRRIHAVMGTRGILLKALRRLPVLPRRVLELGAGDASLTLRVAQALAPTWQSVHLTLLDRRNVVPAGTVQAFERLGWKVQLLNADVLEWIASPAQDSYDLVIANLFLHHFEAPQLTAILAALSQRSHAVCACEPRRSHLALAGSRMVGLLGANVVTREDAVLSVKAGFADKELSQQMHPTFGGWHVDEYAAGLFTHCLLASRGALRQAG